MRAEQDAEQRPAAAATPDQASIPQQRPGPDLAAKIDAIRSTGATVDGVRQWELTAQLGRPGQLRPPRPQQRVLPRWRIRYTAALVIADTFVAAGAATVTAPNLAIGALFVVLFLGALTVSRVYEHRFVGHGAEEFRRHALAAVSVVAICSTASHLLDEPARLLVVLGAPVAGAVSWLGHAAARQALHAMRRRGRCRQRVIVIGLERSVDEIAQALGRVPHSGFHLVGACVKQLKGATIGGIPVLGEPAEVLDLLGPLRADTVLLTAWSHVTEIELRHLSWGLEGSGVQLLLAPRLTAVAVSRMHVQTVGRQPLLCIDEPEFRGLRRVTKGLLDLMLAGVGLLLALPLTVPVALAVGLSSPGGLFFRQERVGRDGRTFRMIKFRSMYADAEQRLAELAERNEHADGPLFKMRDDPRITPVGRFIRRYSLDELPQLVNVLCRQMSLVGPRPPLPAEVARYEQEHRRRLHVKPGITGLWQVSGRSDLSWEESIALDLYYVENWSPLFDVQIITQTVGAVLARRGAY